MSSIFWTKLIVREITTVKIKHLYLMLIVVLGLLVSIALNTKIATAGVKWWSSSQIMMGIGPACQDGVDLKVKYYLINYDQPQTGSQFGIYQYDQHNAQIGALIKSKLVKIKLQRPLSKDLYSSFYPEMESKEPFGYDRISYYLPKDSWLYAETSGNPDFPELPTFTVEDCFLDIVINQASHSSILQNPFIIGKIPTGMYYQITRLPQLGRVELNRQTLSLDGKFTQTDVDNGWVAYVQDGSSAANDRIVLQVKGLTRVSVNQQLEQSNGKSSQVALSTNGDIAAFSSLATNLGTIRGEITDTDVYSDVIVHYLWTGYTSLQTQDSNDGSSTKPSIITDPAEYWYGVSYEFTPASYDDTDIFNVTSRGFSTHATEQAPKYYRDGEWVFRHSHNPVITTLNLSTGNTTVFESETPGSFPNSTLSETINLYQGVDYDALLISTAFDGGFANGGSFSPSESGGDIAFESDATNLLAVPQQLPWRDIFVRHRQGINQSITQIVSVAIDGGEANGNSYTPSIDTTQHYTYENGYIVGLWETTNIAFSSDATNLVTNPDVLGYRDIFVRDITGQKTIRISNGIHDTEANGNSYNPKISNDGRYVVFESDATNLLEVSESPPNFRDIYLYDRDADENEIYDEANSGAIKMIRISSSPKGQPGNGNSYRPDIARCATGDECFVAFDSEASNLVENDTNGVSDVFVYYSGVEEVYNINLATIAVTSTLGTNHDYCGTSNSLTADQFTPIHQCLVVKNTGRTTFNQVTLKNAELSVTIPITLEPSAEITITPSLLSKFGLPSVLGPITATQSYTNAISAIATDHRYTGTQSTSNYIRILTPAIEILGSIGLSSDECNLKNSPLRVTESLLQLGKEVVYHYCLTLRNTGEVPLTIHDLLNNRGEKVWDKYKFNLSVGKAVNTSDLGLVLSSSVTKTSEISYTWTAYQVENSITSPRISPLSTTVTLTIIPDLDNDKIPDELDDTNNNGVPDAVEGMQDKNQNGIPDYRDIDTAATDLQMFLPIILK